MWKSLKFSCSVSPLKNAFKFVRMKTSKVKENPLVATIIYVSEVGTANYSLIGLTKYS